MKTVTVGKDMFLCDVFVGQHVLFMRAEPGGVGLGQIEKIEVIENRSGNVRAGWKYGYNHFKTQRMDIWYKFHIKTKGGRTTTKYFNEIIGRFDMGVYERIKNE